jgi:DNA modification methylase
MQRLRLARMILIGDVRTSLKNLADGSVQCVVTSPPYWGLRDYGRDDQIGLEATPELYVSALVSVFNDVRRVLRDDGTLWLNLGDSYAGNNSRASNNGRAGYGNAREGVFERIGDGLKTKDLVGIPWRVAFALQADGWYLRQDIIWHKPNPLPESVKDRCTKAHEYIFLLSKSPRYYFDYEAIKEPTVNSLDKRNRRDVWTVPVKPFKGAHFATFPTSLITPCILAGCPEGGVVLDPFFGAGTTGLVAQKNNRKWIGCELNADYARIAENRIINDQNIFQEES